MKENLLKYVDLKLARTLVQIVDLNNQVLLWEANDDIHFKLEMREKNLGYKIIVSESTNPELFDQWGLIIGEIMHNLRSCLDNLAFALARLKQDPPSNPNQISFPIYLEQEEFNKKVKPKLLRHISSNAVDLIEKFQPFQRLNSQIDGVPKTDALFVLQWINNVDKHRVPSVLVLVPNEHKQEIKIEYCSEDEAKLDVPPQIEIFGYPIEKGSVVVEHKTNYPLKKIIGNINYRVIASIQGPNGNEPLAILIPGLHGYVSTVINYFRLFFE